MSDDSNAPVDLSSIGMDLSQIFRPSWTVESTDSTARLAAKYDDGGRSERPDRQGGNRRNEGQGHRGPRPGGNRDRDSRGPRPQSGGRDAKAGPGGERGSRDRGAANNSRDPRDRRQEDRRPEPAPKPMLEGWKISLVPEHSALEAIAKQIRSRAKAYPLFELARLVINLSERYSVALKPEGENSPTLFRTKTDGSLWSSRKAAISHLLSKHLEKFYRRSSITTEAPKGSYSVVAQCGMSGVLLGPPNHHEYQSRLLSLHASRFKNLPFEVYKTRIKMMRDDALMEQWKTEQSTRTVFVPIEPESEITQVIEEVVAEASDLTEVSEVSVETPTEELPVAGEAESTEAPVAESVVAEAAAEPELAAEEAPVAEAAASDGAQNEQPTEEPQLTLEEVTEHFQQHHAENEIESVTSDITVPGRIALHESDPLLHELLIKTLQELDHFPLPLAQIIGKELTGSGLQIFKAQKKIIHVSVARPRYLDRASTPTSEGSRSILEYLEAHPKQHRDKQWAGLLALRTEPAGDDAESVKQREQSLGTDLIWLLHQGHVLDFAMGNLQAAIPPVQQHKPTQIVKETPAPAATEVAKRVEPEPAAEVVEEEQLTVEEAVVEEPPAAIAIESIAPIAPIPVAVVEEPVVATEPAEVSEVSAEPKAPLNS